MGIKSTEIQMIEFIDIGEAIKEKLPQYNGYDIWEVFNEDYAYVTFWDFDAVKFLYDTSSDLLIHNETDEWQERVNKVSAATLDLIRAGELPDEFIICMK